MIATDGSYASELDRVGCVDDAGRCTRLDRPPLIDDYWGLPAAAIARRTLQVVIIGAGMDSLGLRRPGFPSEVEVFEIDHPATQELKLQRMSGADVAPPAGVCYLPADLNFEGVDELLGRSGFDARRPAFFSWLGLPRT